MGEDAVEPRKEYVAGYVSSQTCGTATHHLPSTLELRPDVLALQEAEGARDIAKLGLAVTEAQHRDLSTHSRRLLDIQIAAIPERTEARARRTMLRKDIASMKKRYDAVKKEVDALKGLVSSLGLPSTRY